MKQTLIEFLAPAEEKDSKNILVEQAYTNIFNIHSYGKYI